MWVWHATDDEKTAKHFAKHGIKPSEKPSNLARSRYEKGEDAEYAPGRGLSHGTYIGSTPQDVSGYGRHLLAIRVKRGHLKVPPEREALGWKSHQGGHALADNDAVITHRVHPKNVHYFGRSDKYPKDAYHEFVQHALRSGHHVPEHVMKDYPHLQTKKVNEDKEFANTHLVHSGSGEYWHEWDIHHPKFGKLGTATLINHDHKLTKAKTARLDISTDDNANVPDHLVDGQTSQGPKYKLGVGHVKGLLRHIHSHIKLRYPNIENIESARETGIKANTGKTAKIQIRRQSKAVNEMSGEENEAAYRCEARAYQKSRKYHHFDNTKLHNLPEPGETPIPHDHIRLYHQTSEAAADHIKKHGIKMEHAKGIEGPKAVWADPHGFYGHPSDHHTVEFHIPKKDWNGQGHIHRSIEPHEILAVHHP